MRFLLQFAACLAAASILLAQGQKIPGSERQVGVVSRCDAASRELVVALDAGGERRVVVSPQASLLRVAPGEKDLTKAMTILLAAIETGDRVLVRGTTGEDRTLLATTIVVINKGDLARKQETERAEWTRRGISGKVTAIDPAKRELTITTPARPTPASVAIRLADNAIQRRYRPDSTRFSDALPSTLADIKIGDQIHALGEKGANDGVFIVRQIVSGSFRTFAAVVTSLDIAQRILSVKEVDGDKPALVRIGPDCILRKLTPEIARQLVRNRPEKPDAVGDAKEGNRDPQTIFERMPVLLLEQLKPGDALIIASALNPGPGPVLAITVLGGAEPLLTQSASAQRELLGSWELNIDPSLP